MTTRLKIDFVSDVSCPWCVIGLKSLETALARLGPDIDADLRLQPYELNPQLPREGQDIDDYFKKKHGVSREQIERSRDALRQRGEEIGFDFHLDQRTRIYNTFDAHRLLHWASTQGRQRELKHALFGAYFTDGRDISDREVLADLATRVGLDAEQVRAVLASDAEAGEVRRLERFYHEQGVSAVPSIIINDRYLIQGGQPVEVFERALRNIAAEKSAA